MLILAYHNSTLEILEKIIDTEIHREVWISAFLAIVKVIVEVAFPDIR